MMSSVVWMFAAVVAAQDASTATADVERAMRLLAEDPPIVEVQRAALQYFRVSQDDIGDFQAAARWKALLPTLTGSYSYDDGSLLRSQSDRTLVADPAIPQITERSNDNGRAYSASANWNLSSLVFDPSQLETYALVGIHEDVVKEVTRLYYTRQHNVLALVLSPPADARAKAALLLRTRELEAMLDAMTGNAWSRLRPQASKL
jgi:hypothetical protein